MHSPLPHSATKGSCYLAMLGCLLFVGMAKLSAGELSPPSNTVGVCNPYGELEFSGHLGTIELSPGEKDYLYYQYQSNRNLHSNYLGTGFQLPLAESSLIDHDWYLARTTLGGSTRYLYQAAAHPEQFQSLDRSEQALRSGRDTFTVSTREGYQLKYEGSYLREFTTPDKSLVRLEYTDGVCRKLINGLGQTIWEAIVWSGNVTGFRTREGEFHLEFQDYPPGPEGGPTEKTLSAIVWPDKKRTEFKYSKQEDLNLVVMEMSYGERTVRYAWEPFAGGLREAGGIRYMSNPLQRFVPAGNKSDEKIEAQFYNITRYFPDGQTTDYWQDEANGLITVTESSGRTTRTQLVTARGPAFNKVSRIERMDSSSSGGDFHTIYQAYHDLEGRLIRKEDAGSVTYRSYPDMPFNKSTLKAGEILESCDNEGRILTVYVHQVPGVQTTSSRP